MITIISRRRWQQLTAENKRLRDELDAHRDMLKNIEKKIRRMEGSIDTVTAPQLEAELETDGVTELAIDVSKVPYVSSAGLRVFLAAYKAMSAKGGSMSLVGAQPAVMDVLRITGFAAVFNLA